MENHQLSRAIAASLHPHCPPGLRQEKQGVKRGTLLKVRHDGTALYSQLFFSHLLTGNGLCICGNCECWDGWTGNACEIWVGAEYWGGEDSGVRGREPGCPERPEHRPWSPPGWDNSTGDPQEEGEDNCNYTAFVLLLYWLQIILGVVGKKPKHITMLTVVWTEQLHVFL